MNKKVVFEIGGLLTGLVFVGMSFAAPAPRKTPGVDKREHRQAKRVQQGVRSGELTQQEAQQLRQGQKEVRQKERESKSDGVVTKQERKDLHKAQNQQSKEIHQQKHDAEKR